jgi:regulator of cell morphogenesis and NO signaling
LENKKPSGYSIDDYVKEHDNIEDKLNDLINIIVKYLPEEILPDERISVWFDLVQVAADLNKHAKIENTILVPFVRIIENRIR